MSNIYRILCCVIYILILLRDEIKCNIFNSSSISINVIEGRTSNVELVLKNPADHSVTPDVQIVDRVYNPQIMKQQKPPDDILEEYSENEENEEQSKNSFSNSSNKNSKRISGRLIIKYKEKVLTKAVKELSIAGIMSKNGQYPKLEGVAFLTKVISTLSETAEELVGIKSATVLEALDMMIVEVFNNSKASEYISKLSASFIHSDEVEYVEPDQEVRLADLNFLGNDMSNIYPNDPKFSEQWGMYNKISNTDSKVLMAWKHLGINSYAIGNSKNYQGIENKPKRDVIVAVIDTGVDFTHPDLVDNMWVNEKELYGRPGVDDDLNGYVDDIYGYDFANNKGAPIDDEGHGTHCAGTIAAKGNNNEGISGINWKGVKIMALKFLRGNGIGFLSDSVKAINYAIKMGAHILSNSWGGGSFSQATYDAIKRSIEKNMLFVVAAGNDHNNNDIRPTYPSAYQLPNVLSVAAIDINGRLGIFSNYGHRSVDMAAPGVDILSTSSNKGYRRLSGTSMACPFVSGAAALLYAFDPSMTFDFAKNLLLKSVTILPTLRTSVRTSGTLNIYRAVQMMNQEAFNHDNIELPRSNTWITFKVPEVIGPRSSSTLKITAIGEKPGSYTSNLIVKLLDSNDKNSVLADGKIKTIIHVVNIPRPKAILPNGNSTNLGLSFVGVEGIKVPIPIKNTGIGTLEYMVEFVNIDNDFDNRNKGKFKVYPPLGTIMSVKEEEINRELQVSCIPNSLEGIISGHLMLKYSKGTISNNSNRINVKSAKFPYVRGNVLGESSLLNGLSEYSTKNSNSFPIGTERLAIKLYCKGYGIEVKPPSINRVIRFPETSISGFILFKGLENSIKPRVNLKFKPIQDSNLENEDLDSDNMNVLSPEDLSPTKSYFKMVLPVENFPSKKRIVHRLEGYDREEEKNKVSISLEDVIIQRKNIKFQWIDTSLNNQIKPNILLELLNSDDGVQKVQLPLPWYFLGERIDEIYISVNGFISFSPIYSEAFIPALPSYAPPHGILAPLWTDFTTKTKKKDSQVITIFRNNQDYDIDEQIDQDSWEFIIEWRNVQIKSEQYYSKSATFQCVLNSNGTVKFNYLKIPWNNENTNYSNNLNTNIVFNRVLSTAMLGWESIDGIRGIGIPCSEKFPKSESSIELYPENPKIPWFQLSETIIPPLQRIQMTHKIYWKATIPSNLEERTYKGQIQVSSTDGAISIIPISITALKEKQSSAAYTSSDENIEFNIFNS